jgi:tetratricopeptide (TPR) repeat protein
MADECGANFSKKVKLRQPRSADGQTPDLPGIGDTRLPSKTRFYGVIGLAVLVILAAAVVLKNGLTPDVAVPVPADLAKLDPQLRDYLEGQLKWVRAKPSDPQRQATLGIVYAANQLWAEAGKCFSNVTRIHPQEPLGHLYLAVATQEAGDYAGALQLFRETTKTFPRFAPGYDRLGTALLRAGNADEAETAFQHLIELAADQWYGYAGLGEVKLRQNKFAEAAPLLEKARALEPKARVVNHLLGLAYRGLGRKEEAERELRLGLNAVQSPMPDAWGQIAPDHVRLLPQQIELASDYLSEGRPADVLRVLSEAARYHPKDLTVLEYLGLAYRGLNQFQRARRIAELMLSLNERSISAHVLMADVCLDLDLKDEAKAHADRAVALGPDLPRPYLVKADVDFALGRNQEGLAARQEAFKRDPQNPLIAVDIGDALLHLLGNPREAEKLYEQAVGLNPVLPLAYLRLAETAIQLRQFDRARHALEQARQLDPQAPELAHLETQLAEQEPDGQR